MGIRIIINTLLTNLKASVIFIYETFSPSFCFMFSPFLKAFLLMPVRDGPLAHALGLFFCLLINPDCYFKYTSHIVNSLCNTPSSLL